jgi:hypothetical protein
MEWSDVAAQGKLTGNKNEPYLVNQAIQTLELKSQTRFSAGVNLRAGFVFPGSGGQFVIYLTGGGGLENRKIEMSHDPRLYIEAIIRAGACAAQSKYSAVASTNAEELEAHQKSEIVGVGHIYTSLRLLAGEGNALRPSRYRALFSEATITQVDQALTAGMSEMLFNIRWENGMSPLGKKIVPPVNITKSKFLLNLNVGSDFEIHLTSGLFVRTSYVVNFIRMKNMVLTEDYQLKTPDSQEYKKYFAQRLSEGLFESATGSTSLGGAGNSYPGVSGPESSAPMLERFSATDPKKYGLTARDLGVLTVSIARPNWVVEQLFSVGVGIYF